MYVLIEWPLSSQQLSRNIFFAVLRNWSFFVATAAFSEFHKTSNFFASKTSCLISWVARHRGFCRSSAIVPSWVFHGSKVFSRGYFVGPKHFFVCVSWVQFFFSWVFRVSKIFSCGYFLLYFLSWLISWFKDFHLLDPWERVIENKNVKLLKIHFSSCQFCLY